MHKCFAGLDIGTSGTKVILLAASGAVIGTYRAGYRSPAKAHPSVREIELPEIMAGVKKCLDWLRANEHFPALGGIGLSTAMHSLIGLDQTFQPITNVITWADLRSAAYYREWKDTQWASLLAEATGVPAHPMSPFYKIGWMRSHQKALFNQIRYFADLKSYLILQLTGQWFLDHSLASATGIWSAQEKTWWKPALDTLEIAEDQLPVLCDTTSTYPTAAGLLPAGIPLVVGASDGCLSNYAVIGTDPDMANLTLGTSGAIRVNTPRYTKRQHATLFCYYLREGAWVLGGASNNAGNVLDLPPETYPVQDAEEGQPMFFPFHFGERSPVQMLEAYSCFRAKTSLDSGQKVELMREAILLNVAWIGEQLLEEIGRPIYAITLTGGLMQIEGFPQLVADVLGTRVIPKSMVDSSGLGAALFAASVLDHEIELSKESVVMLQPDPERAAHFKDRRRTFRDLVESL